MIFLIYFKFFISYKLFLLILNSNKDIFYIIMENKQGFKFSSNIYSQNVKDPRSGISVTSAANIDVAQYWESSKKDSQRPSTANYQRDHLKEM